MIQVAITGANGFIGRVLSRTFEALGHKVVPLTRSASGEQTLRWELGQPLPPECGNIDAVVHLASAALVENRSMASAIERDVSGTRLLLNDIRQRRSRRPIRFVFVSSQSATVRSGNAYGWSKRAIESLLNKEDELIVRPGLVYGEHATGVFALVERLTQLPVVPIIKSQPNIQPIHVQELADCIVKLCTMEEPPRLSMVGATVPMSFRTLLCAVASRSNRRSPIMISLPSGIVRSSARALDWTFKISPSITERVDGLIALEPMPTAASLEILGVKLHSLATSDPAA